MKCVFRKSQRKTQGERKALILYNIKRCLEQVGSDTCSSGTQQGPVSRYCGDSNKTVGNV
jgi:hypothetical protein